MKNTFKKALVAFAIIGILAGGSSAFASGEKFMVEQISPLSSTDVGVGFFANNAGTLGFESFTSFSASGISTEDDLTNATKSSIASWANSHGYSGITSADVLTYKPSLKRIETYSGTTNGSGTYTVSFPTAFSVAPNIQANIINGTDTQTIRITSVSTTGFTVLVRNRTDTLGLLPSYSNVASAAVDVLITEK